MQPTLGIELTACLISVLHIIPGLWFTAYTLLVFIQQVILGYIFKYTESLYPSLIVNFIVMILFIVIHSFETRKNKEKEAEEANPHSELS